jgi:hypothetical protein
MWLKIQYIYDHEHTPTFFCTPAPGAPPKIGSPGKVKRKKLPFPRQRKTFSSLLPRQQSINRTQRGKQYNSVDDQLF